jgi:S-adenosyl-L-methionine hydrolase (adenosine-forming)
VSGQRRDRGAGSANPGSANPKADSTRTNTASLSRRGQIVPPQPNGVISLLSDFGLQDPFVGILKGVILSRFPEAHVVDLCHGIEPQDTLAARYWLGRSFSWLPRGSTHVAVVDPEVGSQRRVLCACYADHYFVAPDSGILPPSWQDAPDFACVEVDWQRLGLSAASSTFHGRDLFVPIACELAARRRAFWELGKPAELRRESPASAAAGPERNGRVVLCDRFGNLITDLELSREALQSFRALEIAGQLLPLGRTYADVQPGELLGLVNAFGTVEIACRNGSAARTLAASPGWPVRLLPR